MFARATSFGVPSKKARLEMMARVQQKQEVPESALFFQINIKLKDSFTDPNGFFPALSKCNLMEEAPMNMSISFEEG